MRPAQRARQLTDQVSALAAKNRIRFTFLPSPETDFISYFPDDLEAELRDAAAGFEYVAPNRRTEAVDVVILTAHGSNLAGHIGELRRSAPQALVAVWLWDNHLGAADNLATAMAADVVFPSHHYLSSYLITPDSLVGVHVPACCGQWTRREAAEVFRTCAGDVRSDKLFVNYVDYSFSWRSDLLRKMRVELDEAEVLLMAPDDRSRYFGMSRTDRLREWLHHKATIVLPVDRDLSTRVFDALIAGQVLLVPEQIADFDRVIARDVQADLGIIRLADLEMPTIRAAAATAVRVFDEQGAAGALARHEHAIGRHMLSNRIVEILTWLVDSLLRFR